MNEIIILLSIGLIAGFFSGLVGIGGGIIIVPVLIYFLHFTQQQAQGTTLLEFWAFTIITKLAIWIGKLQLLWV